MQQAKEQLKKLIEIGSQFNYKNFRSGTDRSGVPTDYSAEWIAWRSELHAAIIKLFERNSPPTVLVNSGMHERVLYEDEKAFERVKSYFMKAL